MTKNKLLLMMLFCIMIDLFCISTYAAEQKCGGKERWDVKVLNDKDAKEVSLQSSKDIVLTIHELINMRLTLLKRGHDVPRQDFEKRIVTVIAAVQKYKHETDVDLHIVIEDPNTHETMIAESPDPSCVAAVHSGRVAIYKDVRKSIAFYTIKSSKGWSYLKPGTYKITGVLFQDFIHGQTGVAPNGLELHPILDIEKLN